MSLVVELDKGLPPAPIEPSVAVTEDGVVIMNFWFSSKKSVDSLVSDLLSSQLSGCGNVDLLEVQVNCTLAGAGDYVHVGFSASDSTQSAERLSYGPGGFRAQAGTHHVQPNYSATLIVPGVYSRQLRPPSSILPMLRIAMVSSAGASGMMIFKVKIHGPRIVYLN